MSLISTLFCVGLVWAAPDDLRGLEIVDAPVIHPAYREMHALIVGIDSYVNDSLNLEYAVSDAQGVAEMLAERFEFASTTVLRNEEATRANVLSALDAYRSLDPEDGLFIFWAGHGTQENTATGDALGYLVPHDGTFAPDRLLIDNISMVQLKDAIGKRIPAKHKLLVVDACYGGILATRNANMPEVDEAYVRAATSEPAFQVLTAGRADQPVLDGGPGGHSVFTGRFIESLDNIDQYSTASQIHSEVAPRVRQDAFDRGERVQTPVFASVMGLGDFVWIPKGSVEIDPRLEMMTALRGRLKRISTAEEPCAPWIDQALEVFELSEANLVAALDHRQQHTADAEATWMRGLSVLLDGVGCTGAER
ncbi:MAG: caspase family protein [Proteobacteria bacterium]|jgi:hypothetical protein|nr:caspase family protein [Pseudomonadota bacterium]